jgi:hypothetical protein
VTIPQLILDTWADLQRHRDRLDLARRRLQRAPADAEAEYRSDYASNKVFLTLDQRRQRQVLADLEGKYLGWRRLALSAALWHVEQPLPGLERELAAFKRASQRAPEPIDAWVAAVGGDRKYVSDDTAATFEMAHEIRVTRWFTETASWQPSRWFAAYERAKGELTDRDRVRAAASFIAFAESVHGSGWSGPVPVSEDEERIAVNLRTLIDTTQRERIPPEVADIETGIEELKRLAAKARTLDEILPVNPHYDPVAAETYDNELANEATVAQA